ncbi:hypothetical protein [Psychroserpens jangbogonensis]|uniref:hypothetical protein n=1 Tax=Psychroserpens jangbogonensis TaxID=1484460 RepID=UPI00053F1DDD|nr:hypothetical protein [Psychroserpens jangbogonensis]
MRNIVLFLFLVSLFSFDAQSQTTSDTKYDTAEEEIQDPWKLSVGVNAIGSLGERQPFSRLGDFQFRNPLALAIENRWSKTFSLEQDLTFNGYKKGEEIDGGILKEDYTYISTNTYIKYYFSDVLLNVDWLDLYVGAGFGIFTIDEVNTSGNLALGGTVWVSDDIGIRLQGVGKFAVHAKDRQFDNNHFQYMLQVVFKL